LVKPSAALNSPSDDPSVDEAPLLHIDLDAFFASVEILDDPTLVGKPVVVGGPANRGVVASASYEARRFGVRSAMPTVVARRLCPTLIVLPGRFDRYEVYSRKFHDVIRDLTPDYEPLGLDEVFADLRSLRRLNVRPITAARALRHRINTELGLECGVGLGRNKLFAKLASKKSKPRIVNAQLVDGAGVVWVSPSLETQWLNELPVRALWGVGPATAAKLEKLGLQWVRDLTLVDEKTLASHVGPSLAATLWAFAHGEDNREVVVDRPVKSIGHEQTFLRSLHGIEELLVQARAHSAVVARALRSQNRVARTISIVVRYDDFTGVTRSQTLAFGIDDEFAITAIAEALLASIDLQYAVRLLGVHASSFLERSDNQMQLTFGFDASSVDARLQAQLISQERQISYEALRDAVDDVREKFGRAAVGTASELREGRVEIETQRGRHAFGPEET
jgi:DNA polymerase IV